MIRGMISLPRFGVVALIASVIILPLSIARGGEASGLKPASAFAGIADRNARWADWIEQRMARPGTVFLAVGAGHLAGDKSVQAQLAKHKLTATRVAY